MKKPKVEYISHEPFAVIKNNGEWLDSIETCEAYEKMIDALIEARKLIEENESRFGSAIAKDCLKNIEQVLKDAGCEL